MTSVSWWRSSLQRYLIIIIVEGDSVRVAEVAQVGGQVAHAQLQPPLARRPARQQLRHRRVLVDPSDLGTPHTMLQYIMLM